MDIERPAFSPTTLFGYDTDSVDRAVDWAMDRVRQDDPLEEPEVNALRFAMARRNGYDPEEVDAWFDSLRSPIPSEARTSAAGRPSGTDPYSSSDPFAWLPPSANSDPFAASAPRPVPPPEDAPPPEPVPEVPEELQGVDWEPDRSRAGHQSWVQLTALVLIVALLGMFIVSYFL